MSMTASGAHSPGHRLSFRQSLCGALLAAAAAVLLRLIFCQNLGLSHYDEGVYATEALAFTHDLLGGFYHQAPDFAPPLYPFLIGLSYRILGTFDYAAILVSILMGGATVGLVFWILESRAGWHAAWCGALALACCPLHLLYSRMGLTDAPFTFFYTLSLALALARLHADRSARRLWWTGGGLGIAAGLAMLTKYDGILILLSATFFEILLLVLPYRPLSRLPIVKTVTQPWPRLRPCWLATLGSQALAWLIALGLYLPWKYFVNAHYGAERLHVQHAVFAKSLAQTFDELPMYLLLLVTVIMLGFGLQTLLAVIGFARAKRAREPWMWVIAGWIAAYVAALGTYTFFIRLTLPLTPLLALPAGLGLAHLLTHRAPILPRFRLDLLAAVIIVFFMAAQTRQTLSCRTDGYREIGDELEQIFPDHGKPGGPRVITQLIPPIVFYRPQWPTGRLLDAQAPLSAFGRRFYLLVDQSVYQYDESRRMLRLWRPWMRLLLSIPNEQAFPSRYNPLELKHLAAIWSGEKPPRRLTDFQLYEVVIPAVVPMDQEWQAKR